MSKLVCKEPGCDEWSHARGMCKRHYDQEYKTLKRQHPQPKLGLPEKALRVDRGDIFKGRWPKVRLHLTRDDIYGRPRAEF